MDIENFLLTIGKNESVLDEKCIISEVFHCIDVKQRPISICNIKYDDKYLLLELPFLKVIKKEDNFIHLLVEDEKIKDELNNFDDILFKLLDDIENREDCYKEFNTNSMSELVHNTFVKTNETCSYIKVFYDKNTVYMNKDKPTTIFNVDIGDMVQSILLIENIRIYTHDNISILKNLLNRLTIHKPSKIYNTPKINLQKINTLYNENECFQKQVVEDISKTVMEEHVDIVMENTKDETICIDKEIVTKKETVRKPRVYKKKL